MVTVRSENVLGTRSVAGVNRTDARLPKLPGIWRAIIGLAEANCHARESSHNSGESGWSN